ncbi:hypothetical protein ILUMI_00922 [Ignelater luminosus]|uniref:Tc1-like transposase DDE domain-containing protein n=1 Tax=Ignelater luminosus TaxID=2038154 RepID=A0A8K0DKP1_IGNLU|nr:hypothetical protein ILUMI_00922 [Ignelater luminosus]
MVNAISQMRKSGEPLRNPKKTKRRGKPIILIRKIKPEGRRYVVVHALSSNGFIPRASLIFASKTNDPNFDGKINKDNFLTWFRDQLLTKLEEPYIITIDNACYHSSLVKNKINHISKNKPAKVYAVDQMALEHGNVVVRLPPYHCIFNPIENIWRLCKKYYNKHIGEEGYGREKCLAMWKKAIDTVTSEIWKRTVGNTNNVILKWWQREVRIDREEVAPLIIKLEDDSGESGDFEFDDEED